MSTPPLPVPSLSRGPIPLPERAWNSSAIPLGDTIRALTLTLMGSTDPTESTPDDWRVRVRGLISPLRRAFAHHRAATEGDYGLYAEVVQDAPRLARAVHTLVAEHQSLDTAMTRLADIADEIGGDAEALRRGVLQVLGDLSRHRQHDADLVYEAYTTDIGGD